MSTAIRFQDELRRFGFRVVNSEKHPKRHNSFRALDRIQEKGRRMLDPLSQPGRGGSHGIRTTPIRINPSEKRLLGRPAKFPRAPFFFAFAVGFVTIASLLRTRKLDRADYEVSKTVVARRTAPRTVLNAGLTIAGSSVGVVALLLAFNLRKDEEEERALARYLLFHTAVLGAVNSLVKLPFKRQRPPFELYREVETGFPSSHASASVAFFGLLALMVVAGGKHRWLAVPLVAFIPSLGFSRVYLGVHWPSDVLAGYCLGGMILFASLTVMDELEKKGRL